MSTAVSWPAVRGWGDSFTRDRELVLQDVRNKKLSIEFAAREHGVVISGHPYRLDWPATERARSSHHAECSRCDGGRPLRDDGLLPFEPML